MMESMSEGIRNLSLQFVPFMMAVIFHEFAHGFVANRWGDSTAKDEGRLTLNPVPHIDPLGTLILPLIIMATGTNILFGWAKPVPINPNRFKKYRPGLFWVSLAGPGMNVILAFVSGLAFWALRTWMPEDNYLYEPLSAMAYVSVSLNFALAIFNMLPLPPLDGSKVIQSFLSYDATQKYEAIAQYSFWILLALIMTGALSILGIPIRFLTQLTLFGTSKFFPLGDLAS